MVRIITDSAADFSPRELSELGISCIPLTVIFGDTEYQENVNLSKDQFYDLLRDSQSLPKTAQASPQILIDLFEDAAKNGDEAIYMTLSSALSGTYQSALMAQSIVGSDSCHVVDSRTATGGQRMLVEYAVKLRNAGKNAAQIASAVEALRNRVKIYACMDTMENLYMGGRISHTIYTLGTIANIKPIITVDTDGNVQVPAKAMGMRKGMEFICKQVQTLKQDTEYPLYVMYTNNRDAGRTLAAKFEAMGIPVDEAHIIQVGAAIGTHIGFDAVGVVFVHE